MVKIGGAREASDVDSLGLGALFHQQRQSIIAIWQQKKKDAPVKRGDRQQHSGVKVIHPVSRPSIR